MLRTTKKRKYLLALIFTMLLVFSLGGLAGAETRQDVNGNGAAFSLDTYALHNDQGAALYLHVTSADGSTAAPEALKKVQVKVTGTDGQLKSTENYKNVSSPKGHAEIDLGDVPLNDTVSVQVLVQTGQTVNTEVLNDTTAVTEFAVNPNEAVTTDFKGYGAQMNSYVYTALNKPENGWTGNEPPQEIVNLEGKVASLKPGLSRIFLSPANYDPQDPDMKNRMDSFYKTVELAQKVGADVNITWWYLEHADWNPKHPERYDATKTDELVQKDMREFADTLIDLVKNKGMTAVKEITIQNEPSASGFLNAFMDTVYERSYRLLDQYLKDAGIRDQIKIVGGDLVINNQAKWFNYMADNMGDILDGWSVHIYWNYFQAYYMQDRLNGIKEIYDSIAPEKRKPLEITEYGVRGIKLYSPGKYINDFDYYRRNGSNSMTNTAAGYYQEGNNTPYYDPTKGDLIPVNETNIAAFQQAWFNMQAANMGFVGFSKWDMFRAQYDFSYQDHSLIGYVFDPASGQDRWPLRPAYYMTWLMANAIGQGGQVLEQAGSSGTKIITPYRTFSGDYSVFALNTDDTAAAAFSIGDLPADTKFNVVIWNADGKGKLTSGGIVNSGAAGAVSVTAPAGSVVALTTASLALPQ